MIVVFAYAVSVLSQAAVLLWGHGDDTPCSDPGLQELETMLCGPQIVMNLCIHSWCDHLTVFLAPPCFILDLLLHSFQCSKVCQDAVLESFARTVDWRHLTRDRSSWDELEVIAKGAHGIVHLAHLKEDPDSVLVALKKPMIEGPRALRQTIQEAGVLAQIQQAFKSSPTEGSQFVIRLRGFCAVLPEVSLMTEHCPGGTLMNRLTQLRRDEVTYNPQAPDSGTLLQRLLWARQVALGMQALHNIGVAHRDLKSENVLLSEDETVRISDFGLARVLELKEPCALACSPVSRFATANVGTLAFMAPECVRMKQLDLDQETRVAYDPIQADVYSYGFVLYECLTFNREPLAREELATSEIAFTHPSLTARDFVGTAISFDDSLVPLMQRCFDPDASNRPLFPEICSTLAVAVDSRAASAHGRVIPCHGGNNGVESSGSQSSSPLLKYMGRTRSPAQV
eukprot:TRINITY_DN4814_c0_g1_i6.p1 TRINITY_DN4814_c0_g1~~TRINITY_DN4814_c0_g1_i6.p1  ORF type:complete len:455 (-),score=98.95 TRINITY_DN4814_c0_g1_i6:28-1392(-)